MKNDGKAYKHLPFYTQTVSIMLCVNAVIKIKPGTEKEFLEKVQPLLAASRKDEGCISYALYKNTEDENTFMMIERWESPQMLEQHSKAPHFIRFGEEAGPLMADAIDIQTYSAKE